MKSDSNVGSHRDTSTSASALVSTLIPSFVAAAIFLVVFLLLRKKQRCVYAPRTYLDILRDDQKTPAAPNTMLGWIGTYWNLPDTYILNHHSLDAYLFVRFLKLLAVLTLVGCCMTWPVLFPVNATGGAGAQQLDTLTFGNVADPAKYFAHAVMAWLFFAAVMFTISRESLFLIKLRQAYLLTPWHASHISTKTVLFTSIPREYLSVPALLKLFPSARRVWIPLDAKKLEKMTGDAEKTTLELEEAEVKFCRSANAARIKHAKETKTSRLAPTVTQGTSWQGAASRPTARKMKVGPKVDTIQENREKLASLWQMVREEQESHLSGMRNPVGAAFVAFDSQLAAEEAAALVTYHQPSRMNVSQVGVRPGEVIWRNLRMSSWEATLRYVVCNAVICVMVLFWGIPVAFVGILSNVNRLTENVPFLSFINDIPDWILGVITGLLPVILLALLVALVPVFCRFLARQAGAMTLSQVELQTQTWYFAFVLIQVFLVTTFTSSATAVASDIVSDPTSAPQILARNLPKASNFYISYFVLYGIGISALYLLNPGALFKKSILAKRFAKTPRKIYESLTTLNARQPGADYPKFTNLGVIAVVYSCIAPLVLGFATIGFSLLYLAYRYNFLYAYGAVVDTKGAAYAKALQQLVTGLYLAEICLIGLFGVGSAKGPVAVGPLAMMVILLVVTIVYHCLLRKRLDKLIEFLPRDLLTAIEPQPSTSAANGFVPDSPAETSAPSDLEKGHGAGTRRRHSIWKRLVDPEPPELNPHFRRRVPPYGDEVESTAYLHPGVSSKRSILWLTHDDMGLSEQEMRAAEGIVPVSDTGATFDDRNNVRLTEEGARNAPVWKERTLW
ncbi:phosphate metabolism protein 7 [Madurella fahalii]|uniref:Phosphate metabolism protein 7 n=1 Tax=Madurella fahalii TaxID=1157608 RepID=A0ABQ0GGQ9_9PEZI